MSLLKALPSWPGTGAADDGPDHERTVSRDVERRLDYWPGTHDNRDNEEDYEISLLRKRLDSNTRRIRRWMGREDISNLLAATIGPTRLFLDYWSSGDNDGLTQKLDGDGATRVYICLDSPPSPGTKS